MPDSNDSRGIWAWQVVQYCTGLALILFTVLYLVYGFTEEGIRHSIRWSAKISFSLFCLAFASQGIHHILKNSLSWWLRMNRKYLGISFAIVHLIHLGFIFVLQAYFHPIFEQAAATSLVGGGIAYFFVVAMLLTSFEIISNKINKKAWKVLHTIGGYWIWTIFLSTYIKRLDEPIHWIFIILLLIVFLIRLNTFRKT